jgi:hypothetical protein
MQRISMLSRIQRPLPAIHPTVQSVPARNQNPTLLAWSTEMKSVLLGLVILVATATVAFGAAPSSDGNTGVNTDLYHSYDGLICSDCHTIHNSEDGATVDYAYDGVNGPYQALLYRGDFTDLCLSCHMQGQNTSATAALPRVSDTGWQAPIVMTTDGVVPAGISMPGGDFYWSSLDPKKGHNPAYTEGALGGAATSLFMTADPTLGDTPPGGVIDNDDEWSCHTCHGMHSRFSSSYTAWRQVQRKVNGIVVSGDVTSFGVETSAGNKGTTAAGFEPILSNSRGDVQGTSYVNVRADNNPLEGADLFLPESDTNKNVYRGGFSSFCSACHGDFHGGTGETRAADNGNTRVGGAWLRHPTNVKMNESGSKYGIGTYTKQVTNVQGTNPNPVGYDWRYPLIQPDNDFTVKVATASMADGLTAIGDDRMSCLTCHKAHATQYDNMTRWDAQGHAFLPNAAADMNGAASDGDNPAYGCGKCHQKGGSVAFVKTF